MAHNSPQSSLTIFLRADHGVDSLKPVAGPEVYPDVAASGLAGFAIDVLIFSCLREMSAMFVCFLMEITALRSLRSLSIRLLPKWYRH